MNQDNIILKNPERIDGGYFIKESIPKCKEIIETSLKTKVPGTYI